MKRVARAVIVPDAIKQYELMSSHESAPDSMKAIDDALACINIPVIDWRKTIGKDE